MGPFPHDAAPAEIGTHNPAGTDGFEFVEFAHPEPEELHNLFRQMGYTQVAKHKTKDVFLYRQGTVNYILNAEAKDFAADFVKEHGPCASSMAWRVVDPQQAYEHAVANGAKGYDGDDKVIDAPAILGIGGSLLYFIARDGGSPYMNDYDWAGEVDPQPEGLGFFYIDHLTHNVHRGNMNKWYGFYSRHL